MRLPPAYCHRRKKMLRHGKSLSRLVILAAAILGALNFASPAKAQTDKTLITPEAMWLMKRVGAPAPSPDGKWVVFSMIEPAYDEKDQVSDLWIVPSDGGGEQRG